jgi:low molecular weight phosphotyrosine protein phosphatase
VDSTLAVCAKVETDFDNAVRSVANHTSFQHRIPISHKARRLSTSDFTRFTHILAADGSNLRELQRRMPSNATADIRLWGSYLDNQPIPDPYYDGTVS